MSQRKRATSVELPASKKPSAEERVDAGSLEQDLARVAVLIEETELELRELRQRQARLLRKQQIQKDLETYKSFLRPVLASTLKSWIAEFAFPVDAEFEIVIREIGPVELGEKYLLAGCHPDALPFPKFSCNFEITTKLTGHCFARPVVNCSVQESKLLCSIGIVDFPADVGQMAAMQVEFHHHDNLDVAAGTIHISAWPPFHVLKSQTDPRAPDATHFANVLFYSTKARYSLMESMWALASLVLVDWSPAKRITIHALRAWFLHRIRLTDNRYKSLVGELDEVSKRMTAIQEKVDAEIVSVHEEELDAETWGSDDE